MPTPFRDHLRWAFEDMIFWGYHCYCRASFGLTERVDELHPGKCENCALDQRWRHGRPAIGDDIQAAQVVFIETGMVKQLLEHRRDHQRAARLVFGYELEPLASLELAF